VFSSYQLWHIFCGERKLTAKSSTNCTIDVDGGSDSLEKSAFSYTTRPVPGNTFLAAGNMSESNIEAKGEMQTPDMWKPQKKELLVMISLSFISLMVALDATILVTVLPVSWNLYPSTYSRCPNTV
jgi:hypothetical protein